MNIGIVVPRLSKTGPVNVIYNMLARTKDKNINYFIFTTKAEIMFNTRIDDFKKLDITIIELQSKKYISRVWELNRNLKKYHIDIVHGHAISFLFIILMLKGKFLFTLHFDIINDWKIHGSIFFKILFFFIIKCMKKCERIVCCADYISSALAKYDINTISIPNGVNVVDKSILKNDRFNELVYCGSLSKRKDVYSLAYDFSKIDCKYKLLLVGSGELENTIRELKNDSIELLGFVDDVSEYLKHAMYFISYSKSEGLPLAVLEAIANGVPVILSDIPSHREIVNNKKCEIGVIIKKSLEESLLEIEKKDYLELSRNAYEVARTYYSNEVMENRYRELYKKLI